MSEPYDVSKCIYYREVKDMELGEAKIFNCPCRLHDGDVSVVCFEKDWTGKCVREVKL